MDKVTREEIIRFIEEKRKLLLEWSENLSPSCIWWKVEDEESNKKYPPLLEQSMYDLVQYATYLYQIEAYSRGSDNLVLVKKNIDHQKVLSHILAERKTKT